MNAAGTPQPTANGLSQDPRERARLEAIFTAPPLTTGYTATLPLWAWESDWLPQIYLIRDIELMMTHPIVRSAINYFKAGIAAVEFDISSLDQRVTDFVLAMCQRFWDRGVPVLQNGYEYGWIGAECNYRLEDGLLEWDSLDHFSPRDTFLLTQAKIPVGVRIKNITQPSPESPIKHGRVDLWMASEDVPAKGLWYAHEPRYSKWYGQSQLIGAWRPWRRLAWKDGAETVIDTGVYRFAFAGPQVRYPDEDLQVSPSAGAPATTLDSQGRPRRYARDMARQIAEQAKTGAGIGLPSGKYPPEMGGGEKWELEWPKHVMDVAPLIGYAKWLQEQIDYGIGVPPELLQASEGGSGYSGRKIPREAFLMRNQRIADAILELFIVQVLRPLVRWNFGNIKFTAKIRNILMTERKAQTGQDTETPPNAQPPQQQLPDQGGPGGGEAGGANMPAEARAEPMTFSLGKNVVTERIRQIAMRILKQRAA